MNAQRSWMYNRMVNGYLPTTFVEGVENFIQFAKINAEFRDGVKLKCPCNHRKCKNTSYFDVDTIKYHLVRYGFVPNYYIWSFHGESHLDNVNVGGTSNELREEPSNMYEEMIRDAFGPNVVELERHEEEPPNLESQAFYDMLAASNKPLWPGCENHSQLSFVARLLNLKSKNHMSERCFDQITSLIKEIVPTENLLTDSFYKSKRLLRGMGLPAEKIDSCLNNCMIYWQDDSDLTHCKFCNHARFKPTNMKDSKRLKRLYASNATANYMRWHAEHVVEEGVMHHPSDSEAWKHFDNAFPDFAKETRNVRLGLCTDGFQPFGSFGQQYSSWPVILTPYNLPPGMCMRDQYMFLTVLIPGPRNPKDRLDVFLQPLIHELKELWYVGATSYDISKKQNFQLRAALMWTISDFPAYSMLSGWSTAGKKACPYCMETSDAFTLRCSGKQSWFDNHRKFLAPDHQFRRNKISFRKNKTMTTPPPNIRSGHEILAEIESLGLLKVTELDAERVNAQISKTSG